MSARSSGLTGPWAYASLRASQAAEPMAQAKREQQKGESPIQQVQIDIVAGPQGATFQPASLSISAGTMCLWRNLSGESQDVLPVENGPSFKGARWRQGQSAGARRAPRCLCPPTRFQSRRPDCDCGFQG